MKKKPLLPKREHDKIIMIEQFPRHTPYEPSDRSTAMYLDRLPADRLHTLSDWALIGGIRKLQKRLHLADADAESRREAGAKGDDELLRMRYEAQRRGFRLEGL